MHYQQRRTYLREPDYRSVPGTSKIACNVQSSTCSHWVSQVHISCSNYLTVPTDRNIRNHLAWTRTLAHQSRPVEYNYKTI